MYFYLISNNLLKNIYKIENSKNNSKKMGKYGKVAKIAAEILTSKKGADPLESYEQAVNKVSPDSLSSRNKSCPKLPTATDH